MTSALVGLGIAMSMIAGWALTQWGEEMERQAKTPRPQPEPQPNRPGLPEQVYLTDPDGVRLNIPTEKDPWE